MSISKKLTFQVNFTTSGSCPINAGTLQIDVSTLGDYKCIFDYSNEFMDASKYLDLCPASLPRVKGTHHVVHRPSVGLPFAFQDAQPDAWGKAVIARAYDLSPRKMESPFLLRYINSPMGAISFVEVPPNDATAKAAASKRSIKEKVKDVLSFSAGESIDKIDMSILAKGSSSGGVRPKINHEDEEGKFWIVKPAVPTDHFPLIKAELLCGDAAYFLGLTQEKSRLINLAGIDVLFVPRFDVTRTGGRFHCLTMKSILGKESNLDGSYLEIARKVDKLCKSPDVEKSQLFRQMLLNCLIGNIDDHLKNFSMIWRDESGWELSPAYDITPAAMMNIGFGANYHSIGFFDGEDNDDHASRPPDSLEKFLALGVAFGLDEVTVQKDIASVILAVEWVKDSMTKYGIEGVQAEHWQRLIEEKLAQVKPYASVDFSR